MRLRALLGLLAAAPLLSCGPPCCSTAEVKWTPSLADARVGSAFSLTVSP